MKIGITGDWHIRYSNPLNRIGSFFLDQFGKIKWILDKSEEENISYIVQAGDFFDYRKTAEVVKKLYIDLFRTCKIPILCVYGQHDLEYHKNRDNTSLAVLEAAGVVKILGSEPYMLDNNVYVYGASWGEPIPKSKNDTLNILVTHQMIVEDGPLWPGQTNFTSSKAMIKSNKSYNLFACGDNHKRFTVELNNRTLINPGSLMRSKVDQAAHKPTFYIYDTETHKVKEYAIPVKPAEDVLKLEEAAENKLMNANLETLKDLLKAKSKSGVSFEDNVRVLKEAKNVTERESFFIDMIIDSYKKERKG